MDYISIKLLPKKYICNKYTWTFAVLFIFLIHTIIAEVRIMEFRFSWVGPIQRVGAMAN